MTINGSANVHGLYKFCNPEKIRKDINHEMLEEAEIIKNPTVINYDSRDILRELHQFLEIKAEVKADPMQQPAADVNKKRETAENKKIASSVTEYMNAIKPKEPKDSSVYTPRESKIDDVLYGLSPSLDIETQKKREEKMHMLESIQHLRDELVKMNFTLDDIPTVDSNNSYDDVRAIYSILKYKKNLNMHYEIAKDCILFGVKQLTNIFDGSKTSWGTMPDLTGWERTADTKLRGLKVELSSVVADFFNHYNVGSLGQICLSLIPSALVHMSLKHEQKNHHKDTSTVDDSLQKLNELDS